MTPFESKCYGMTEQEIREDYMHSITGRVSGPEMVVASILSDCQELLLYEHAFADADAAKERVRKQLNIAKFILSEMMQAKVSN